MFDQEQWFDRSHNVFFDWLIAAGFLGLFAYLALFGAAVFSVIKNKASKFSTTEQSLILALLTAYFVNNIFVFDNLISYVCFFTLSAYIFTDKHTKEDVKEKGDTLGKDVGMFWIIAGLSAFVVAILMFITIYEPLAKNKAISEMYRLTQQGSIEDLKAISTDIARPALFGNVEANEQILMLSGAVIRSKAGGVDKQYFFDLASKQINLDIEEDVLNPRPPVLYAGLLVSLGLYDKAIPFYQEALRRTPTKTLLWLDLAQAQGKSGDIAGATESAIRSHNLSHRSIQSAVAAATLYSMQGKKADSEKVWDETVLANKSSQEALLRRIDFYKGHAEYKKEMAKTVGDFRSLYGGDEARLQAVLNSTTTQGR
jgi:tetratricopeptide (TPR) repeat protein